MLHWNYRVIKSRIDGSLSIHEVYYDSNDDSNPTNCCGSYGSAAAIGDDKEELLRVLEMMKEALDKPILDESIFYEHTTIENS